MPEFPFAPDDNEFNNDVIEKYKTALESSILALDSYFNQDSLINITLFNHYESIGDEKALSKVIELLNKTKEEIKMKIEDTGAGYKLVEALKGHLDTLLTICTKINKKIESPESEDNNVGSLQTKYIQKKKEMELLKEKKFVEFQEEKISAKEKLLSALSEVDNIINTEIQPTFESTMESTDSTMENTKSTLESTESTMESTESTMESTESTMKSNESSNTPQKKKKEIEGKLEIQRKSIKEVHYVYDNEKQADSLLKVIKKLKKLMKHEAEQTREVKSQFYIQLVNRPHFGTGILLFGQSGQ